MASPVKKSDDAYDLLKDRLRVDKHQLDEEEMDQARFYNQCAQEHALAVSYRDEAKSEVDGTYAMLDQQFRAEAEREEKKMTDTAVKSKITAHPRYQEALVKHAGWTYRMNLWAGLTDAAKMRGYALQDLAKLFVAGYWTGSGTASPVQREAKAKRVDEIKEELAEKRKEKPKRERINQEA